MKSACWALSHSGLMTAPSGSKSVLSDTERCLALACAPVAASFATYITKAMPSHRLGVSLLIAALVGITFRAERRHAPTANVMPFVKVLYPLAVPLIACAAVALTAGTRTLSPVGLGIACLVAIVVDRLTVGSATNNLHRQTSRIAVVGSAETAHALASELRTVRRCRCEIVGYIDHPSSQSVSKPAVSLRKIGALGALAECLQTNRLDLLLVSNDAPRLAVFDELARQRSLDVRVVDLSAFYEQVFGRVPLNEINSAWFQAVAHPKYMSSTPLALRLMDIAVAGWLLCVLSPVFLLIAFLVKRDGGPVLFTQTRIGEAGNPFRAYPFSIPFRSRWPHVRARHYGRKPTLSFLTQRTKSAGIEPALFRADDRRRNE